METWIMHNLKQSMSSLIGTRLYFALENEWLIFYRLAVIDLIVAMAPFVDEPSMTQTFELIKPFVEVRIFLLPF